MTSNKKDRAELDLASETGRMAARIASAWVDDAPMRLCEEAVEAAFLRLVEMESCVKILGDGKQWLRLKKDSDLEFRHCGTGVEARVASTVHGRFQTIASADAGESREAVLEAVWRGLSWTMGMLALDDVVGKNKQAARGLLSDFDAACKIKGDWARDVSNAAWAIWEGGARLDALGDKWGEVLQAAMDAKALPRLVKSAGRLVVKLAVEQGGAGEGARVALVGLYAYNGTMANGMDFGGGRQSYPSLGSLSDTDEALWENFVKILAPWIWSIAGKEGRKACLPAAQALALELVAKNPESEGSKRAGFRM